MQNQVINPNHLLTRLPEEIPYPNELNAKNNPNKKISGVRIQPNLLKQRFSKYLTLASNELKINQSKIPDIESSSDVSLEYDDQGLEWEHIRESHLSNNYNYNVLRARSAIQLWHDHSVSASKKT